MRKRGEHFKPKLSLIWGGLGFEIQFDAVRIVAAPETRPPFPVEAVVFEEDTFLVLSAEPVVREPKAHPLRIINDALNAIPERPGTVVVSGPGRPLHFLAIVHDLNQEPTWREEWVAGALAAVFSEAEQRALHSLALPLLGTRHGTCEKSRFAVLLKTAMQETSFQHLRRLWLMVPEQAMEATRGALASALQE